LGADLNRLPATLARVPARKNQLVERKARKINRLSMILPERCGAELREAANLRERQEYHS
jgi:hypothetical protein